MKIGRLASWLGQALLALVCANLIISPASAQLKQSQLPTATAVSPSDTVTGLRGGVNTNFTLEAIANWALVNSRRAAGRGGFASFGHSWIAYSFNNTPGVNAGLTEISPLQWASIYGGQRYWPNPALNFGVAGDTSAQMLARVDAAIATATATNGGPGVVDISDCTNDFPAGSDGIVNMTEIFRRWRAAGWRVVAHAPSPRSGAYVLTSTGLALQQRYYQWIRQYAASGQILLADGNDEMVDPAKTGMQEATGMLNDNLHLSVAGAQAMGRALRTQLDIAFSGFPSPLTAAPGDAYDATNNPTGNLWANGRMIGTGGTTSGATCTAISGSVATSWQLVGTACAGLTVTGSKQGSDALQQIVVSGTPTSASPVVSLRQSITAGNLASGDQIEAMCYIEVDTGSTGINVLGLDNYITDTSGSHRTNAGVTSSFGYLDAKAFTGAVRAPINIVSGTATASFAEVTIKGVQNVPMAITLRIGRCSERKIVAVTPLAAGTDLPRLPAANDNDSERLAA